MKLKISILALFIIGACAPAIEISADMDGNGYTTHAECEMGGGQWGMKLGGIGMSGASFPSCSLNSGSVIFTR